MIPEIDHSVALLRELTVPDWPVGAIRGTAFFSVDEPRVGRQRASRDIHIDGKPIGAARKSIYFINVRFALIAGRTWGFGFAATGEVAIMPGTLKGAAWLQAAHTTAEKLRTMLEQQGQKQ